MGDCKFCGKSAGFLRKEHGACAEAHARGLGEIRQACLEAALNGTELNQLPTQVRSIAASTFNDASDAGVAESLAQGWGEAVSAAMEDHYLSDGEKRALNRYRMQFRLGAQALNREGHFMLFRMMTLLNALNEHGLVPRFRQRGTRLPFNLMKSEEMLWLFDGVGYLEQVTQREFRGGSLGVSFRVAKGVYVRPSAFRGRPVETSSMQQTASGVLGITTKHIYFRGDGKSFRVRLEKIVSFEPYQDGLGIMRDTARAKPEIFRMGAADAWFLLNVIDAVTGMDRITLPKAGAPTLDELVDRDLG